MFDFPFRVGPPARILGRGGSAAIPRPVIEAASRHLVAGIVRRHPGLVSRLAALGSRRIRFEAAELPFAVVLSVRAGMPALDLVPTSRRHNDATVVRGRLALLIGLLEGRLDSDAAFFTRRLTVEGDTEPVVLLRNALEAEEIDLKADLAAAFGPLEPAILPLLTAAERAARNVAAHAWSLHRRAFGPLEDGLARHGARIAALDERIVALETRAARRGVGSARADGTGIR